MSLRERFWGKVNVAGDDECWEWAAFKNRGYGLFCIDRGRRLAHRVAFELRRGTIPDGMHVLHRCDNRGCCNPTHLFLGTIADNAADMVAKGRQAKGEHVNRAKLTEVQVLEIRAARGSNVELARKYLVGDVAISNIRNRKTWAHLPVPQWITPAFQISTF